MREMVSRWDALAMFIFEKCWRMRWYALCAASCVLACRDLDGTRNDRKLTILRAWTLYQQPSDVCLEY